MSDYGLTPDDIKRQHDSAIKSYETFKTHGVSEQAALDYLETDEGRSFRQSLVDADPNAPASRITDN
jgi:hypothetical protein